MSYLRKVELAKPVHRKLSARDVLRRKRASEAGKKHRTLSGQGPKPATFGEKSLWRLAYESMTSHLSRKKKAPPDAKNPPKEASTS